MRSAGTRLLLVRHGQTNWNLEGRYQGGIDVPLNLQGQTRSEALAEELSVERIDVVYSSPLSRAVDTARPIARKHGLDVRIEPDLREIELGEWEGMPATVIAERYPELFRQWVEDPRPVRPPGGESILELHDRVIAAVDRIIRLHPGKRICLVTHKVTLVIIRTHFLRLDLPEEMRRPFPNGTWEWLDVLEMPRGNPCCSAAAVTSPTETSDRST